MVKSSTMTMYSYVFGGLLALGLVVAFALIITLFVLWKQTDEKTTTSSGHTLNDVNNTKTEFVHHLTTLYSSPTALGTPRLDLSGNGTYMLNHNVVLYPLFVSGPTTNTFPAYLVATIDNSTLKISATETHTHKLGFSLHAKVKNPGLGYLVHNLGLIEGVNTDFNYTGTILGADKYLGWSNSDPVDEPQSFSSQAVVDFKAGYDYYFCFGTSLTHYGDNGLTSELTTAPTVSIILMQ